MRKNLESYPDSRESLRPIKLSPKANIFRGMPIEQIYRLLKEKSPVNLTLNINQDNASRRYNQAILWGAKGALKEGPNIYIAALGFYPKSEGKELNIYKGTQDKDNYKVEGKITPQMVFGVWIREAKKLPDKKTTKIGEPYFMKPEEFVEKFSRFFEEEKIH